MRCIEEYLSHPNKYSEKIKKEIYELSGVFPNDDNTIRNFCEYYMDCMEKADILALWGVGAEHKIVGRMLNHDTRYIRLRSLEPYYFDKPWSKKLEEKRVLVVHPFSETIMNQYKKRLLLFKDGVLPQFKSVHCIKAVQSIAGAKTDFNNWFEALSYMKNEISITDFDVAIIGAGAYGLPLTSYCKEIGKQAIQMSGATQILFGIKGKRWDNHPVISKFYNDYWVRPDESETPPMIGKVEGGSYW